MHASATRFSTTDPDASGGAGATIARITPCLWFDTQAEQAAAFYAGIFPNSRVTAVSRYAEAGREVHGMRPGTALMVSFELDGHAFSALNGGPMFGFSEAVSFQVGCASQQELDYYWERLGEGGDEAASQCGWLKDRYGLSWQLVPHEMTGWLTGDPARAGRVMAALIPMKKLDLAALRRAAGLGRAA